ncbi:MAG TPA: VWA domain-containing protein [Pyrinomonadaceae bacterium]|nr:VWA domain-containing protein [Pyrinomonadaceae bacterium]
MPSKTVKVLLAILLSFLLFGSTRSQDPVETIRIESDLVDLKVSVLGFSSDADAALLDQKDFEVLEDGKKQEIAFFAAADAPFDLLLLLDVSGSTSGKLKLIRNSARRFVDAARPIDRLAIMTFSDQPYMLSNYSLDRRQLKKDIEYVDDAYGGTNFWDSLDDVLKNMVPRNPTRRTAIVVMTDGVDNAIPEVKGEGSRTAFETLLENVRRSEALVFPIYLDTQKKDEKNPEIPHSAYAIAHEQLSQIATGSGTTLYHAAKLQDLDQVYAQVIRDLGRIYSIGYRPSNRTLDGKWRHVEVHLVGRPNLQARTKRGYYAKQAPASDTEKKLVREP